MHRSHRLRRAAAHALLAGALLSTAACAAAFGPMRARTFEEAPYYIGVAPRDTLPTARLAVTFDRPDGLDDDHGAPSAAVRRLTALLDAYLDSVPRAPRRVDARPADVGKGAPDAYFGCDVGPITLGDMSCEAPDSLGRPRNMVRVKQPSKGWRGAVARVADSTGAARVLVVQLEFSRMWPTVHGLLDHKEAQLGTGYAVPLPWLTAENRTLDVLTLTGMLVDRDGRVVRAGAEGLLARRTRLLVGALGAEELITDRDVERLLDARRDDLAGRPLVWQVAVENLVAQLTGSGTVRALASR